MWGTYNMEKLTIGDTTIEVSRQAIIASCLFAFMLLAMLAVQLRIRQLTTGQLSTAVVVFSTIALAYAFLIGYSVNCLVVGKCIKLSWFLVALYAVLAMVYALALVGMFVMPKKHFSNVMRRDPNDEPRNSFFKRRRRARRAALLRL